MYLIYLDAEKDKEKSPKENGWYMYMYRLHTRTVGTNNTSDMMIRDML